MPSVLINDYVNTFIAATIMLKEVCMHHRAYVIRMVANCPQSHTFFKGFLLLPDLVILLLYMEMFLLLTPKALVCNLYRD